MGVAILGDSAGAHFSLPVDWLRPYNWTKGRGATKKLFDQQIVLEPVVGQPHSCISPLLTQLLLLIGSLLSKMSWIGL